MIERCDAGQEQIGAAFRGDELWMATLLCRFGLIDRARHPWRRWIAGRELQREIAFRPEERLRVRSGERGARGEPCSHDELELVGEIESDERTDQATVRRRIALLVLRPVGYGPAHHPVRRGDVGAFRR